ncbi:MAG TPA: DUF6130 family protein [Bryobacteraceae bacterium]|nr:DUF6130 family protein [Bryobacteraceae bacterium]
MRKHNERSWWRNRAPVIIASLIAISAAAQTPRQVRAAGAVQATEDEPPAKIIIEAPLATPLSHGRVVVPYRTENLHLTPVFGPAALKISPRVGHVHVSVDDAPWVWMDASGEPLIVNGLLPGPHKILLRLQSANHQLLDEGVVNVTIPEAPSGTAGPERANDEPGPATVETRQNEPPPRLIVASPLPEPLARGVVFIRYRTENLQILPVFGPAAVAVSPRLGHIHVTVDDTTWHWVDASGGPVIINGLRPGRHKIFIQLVNANGSPLDETTVQVEVPQVKQRAAY